MKNSVRCVVYLLASVALLAPALAQNAALKPLPVRSSAEVRNDPLVKSCRQLAARRTEDASDSITTAVEKAMYEFRMEIVADALARCRLALARYPAEPDVIIAHYTASEAVHILLLGLKFPDSEEESFAMALEAARSQTGGFLLKMAAFYVASAYEYGVGTKPDLAEAAKWYAAAANDGDPISKRELARLQASGATK
jgi:hypothetical protein